MEHGPREEGALSRGFGASRVAGLPVWIINGRSLVPGAHSFLAAGDTGALGGASSTEPACQSRRLKRCGLTPGSGRPPGGGNGNPCWYSRLENPVDRGTCSPRGHTDLHTTEAT